MLLFNHRVAFMMMAVFLVTLAQPAVLVPFVYDFESDGDLVAADSSLESGEQQLVRLVRYQPDFEEQISGEVEGDDLSVEASELMAAAEAPYYYPIDYLVVPQQGVRVARHDGHGAAPGHTHTAAELAEIEKQQATASQTAAGVVRPAAAASAKH